MESMGTTVELVEFQQLLTTGSLESNRKVQDSRWGFSTLSNYRHYCKGTQHGITLGSQSAEIATKLHPTIQERQHIWWLNFQ